MNVISIAVFGLLGVLSRYTLDRLFKFPVNEFPFMILIINVVGCALSGMIVVLAQRQYLSFILETGILVGFCGGFTTFSAYALQSVLLFKLDKQLNGLIYLTISPILGISFCYLSIVLTNKILDYYGQNLH